MKTFLFFLLLCGSLYGQNSSFQKTYGGSGAENGWDVVQTNDLGFAAIGTSQAPGQGPSSMFLLRTDRNGDSTWSQAFGGGFVDEGYAICKAHDGGFFLAGKIGVPDSFQANLSNVFLVRADENGNPTWTYENGTSQSDAALAVAAGPDKSVVFTGFKNRSLSIQSHFAYLTKLNAEGNFQWSRSFSPMTTCHSVALLSQGGYLLGGATGNFLGSSLLMIRTDSLGNTLWNNSNSWGNLNGELRHAIQLKDGNFATTGFLVQNLSRLVLLAKTDTTGAPLWIKKFQLGADAVGYQLTETSEGELIVTGSTADSQTMQSTKPFLLRTSSSGDSIQAKSFSVSGEFHAVKHCQDDGFIMCGTAGLDQQILLVKTDEAGDVLFSHTETTTVQVFPNPNSGEFDLQIVSLWGEKVDISIFDPRGRLVRDPPPFQTSAGSYLYPINLSEFASGLYFLRIVAGNQVLVKEVLKH